MAEFPVPPAGGPLGSYATYAANDDYFASPEQTMRASRYPTGKLSRSGEEPSAYSERDAAAETAAVESLRHVVSEYARRAVQDSLNQQLGEEPCQVQDIEFVPTGRCTNDVAMLVTIAVTFLAVLPIMTHIVVIVLGVGAVATYVLDSLGHRSATLYVMLVTLLVGWLAFYFANFADAWASPAAMLIVISVGTLFALIGLRSAMSFKSIQTRSPYFILMADNILSATLPVACTPPLLAMLVGVCGGRLAAFALVPLLCTMHFAFYLPRQSSFLEIATDTRRTAAEELVLLIGAYEAAWGTAFVTFLPAIMYPALTSDAYDLSWFNICNYAFLIAAPCAYALLMDPRLTWWFMRYWNVRSVKIAVAPTLADEEAGGDGVEPPSVTVKTSTLDYVCKYRWGLLFVSYSAMLHFAVERLINSRFAYLFVGVTPPFNYAMLLVIGYIASALFLFAGVLLKEEASGKSSKLTPFLWIGALLASVGVSVAVGVVAGMPAFFIPMMALSAATFIAYVIDRRATNNFASFMCASTITLTWWMFKTFSFIRQDLRVIGERFTVSTNEVAGSVLLAYIIGGICIPLAFQESKMPLTIMMVIHGLKISFLEHVLYSQTADAAYPPYFVAATSLIGIVVAYRLYKNEVLVDIAAAYIMGLYGSKFFVYLVQINVAMNEDATYAFEMFITELFAMAACAVLAIAELRHASNQNITTPQFFSVITCWFIVLALGMRDTVLRLVVEWLGFRRPSVIQLCAASAVACATFGYVLAGRYTTKALTAESDEQREQLHAAAQLRAKLRKWMLFGLLASATLLIVDPGLESLATGENTDAVSDNPFIAPWWSRWAVLCALMLTYAGSRLPLQRIHPIVRAVFFVLMSVLLSFAATPLVVPASDIRVTAALTVFLSAAAATVVACHHGNFESDVCLVMYLVSLVALALGFISLNYVRVDARDYPLHVQAYEIEAHALSRMGMLAIGSAVNLVVAVSLKCYLNGLPLLSGARKIEGGMGSQIALVANYAVIIGYTTMCLLAYWVEADSSAMLVAASTLLLLLHNDGVLLQRLNKGPFRYFPPFVGACATLGWGVQHEMYDLYSAGRAWRAFVVFIGLAMLVPSHFSVGRFLYVPKKRKTTVAQVVALVLLDAIVMLATPSHGVRWLAMVGIVALVGRLVVTGHLKPIADIASL
jgi:hypothetical protein